MNTELIHTALEALKNNQKFASATVVEATVKGTPRKAGAKMIVWENGSIFGTIGGGRNELAAQKECLKSIRSGLPKLITYDYFGEKGQSICGGQIKVFIEPCQTRNHLVICGAGHIALPLSIIAKILNFKITVIDNRRQYATKARFPHCDKLHIGNHSLILKKTPIDSNTYVVIITQGNEYDYECLKGVIKSDAAYIGVISSQAKKIKFFKRLKSEKIPEKLFKKIDIPTGIDIGAQTPEEISISIAARIIEKINNSHTGTAKFTHKKEINK